MKELITVKANLQTFDIFMRMEELDGLPIYECDYVLDRLQRNIKAYQDLRHARVKVKYSEQAMTEMKSESTGGYFENDMPF